MVKIKFVGQHGFKGFFTTWNFCLFLWLSADWHKAERDIGTDYTQLSFIKQQYATWKLWVQLSLAVSSGRFSYIAGCWNKQRPPSEHSWTLDWDQVCLRRLVWWHWIQHRGDLKLFAGPGSDLVWQRWWLRGALELKPWLFWCFYFLSVWYYMFLQLRCSWFLIIKTGFKAIVL